MAAAVGTASMWSSLNAKAQEGFICHYYGEYSVFILTSKTRFLLSMLEINLTPPDGGASWRLHLVLL